ncbi:MAG: hypothetical protein ETSY1_07615 [Candidatus Entotheonella factor]|uniref:Uncharacterized protein n=1 Tax=Entotheonella factor TaxID=1429438 RepID=W4LVI5_ENTF1|nr:MAG: hypothetical protein ETSY1_07615 [Candidatus Entotheonella factor]
MPYLHDARVQVKMVQKLLIVPREVRGFIKGNVSEE